MLRFLVFVSFFVLGSSGYAASMEAYITQARAVAAKAKQAAYGYMAELRGLNALLEDPEFLVPTPPEASAELQAAIAQVRPPLKEWFEKNIIETIESWTVIFHHMEEWETQLSRGNLTLSPEAINAVLCHYLNCIAQSSTARFLKDQENIVLNAKRLAAETLKEYDVICDIWRSIGPYAHKDYKETFNRMSIKTIADVQQPMYFFNGDSIETRYIGKEINTASRLGYRQKEDRLTVSHMDSIRITSPEGLEMTIPFALKPTMTALSDPDECGKQNAKISFPSGLEILFEETNAAWVRETIAHITEYTAIYAANPERPYKSKDITRPLPTQPTAAPGLSLDEALALTGAKPAKPSKKALKAAARAAERAKAPEAASSSTEEDSPIDAHAAPSAIPSTYSPAGSASSAASAAPRIPGLIRPIDPYYKARILALAARLMGRYSNPLPERTYTSHSAMLKADGKAILANLLKRNEDGRFGNIQAVDAYNLSHLQNLMNQLGFTVADTTFTFTSDPTRQFSIHYIHRTGKRLYNNLIWIWRKKLHGIGFDDAYFDKLLLSK
jgi:hypothetical protein